MRLVQVQQGQRVQLLAVLRAAPIVAGHLQAVAMCQRFAVGFVVEQGQQVQQGQRVQCRQG